ncbi:MAG TPA: SusC/RagA family TonB-linked outer membrane protein [Flavisolibacter sp.]|nr:SusC/RagA family TonB-linked outer membrane protein [Flavisolibacter sp.]
MKKIYTRTMRRTGASLVLLLSVLLAFGQGRTLTGKVTDPATGKGVAEVSVVVKGTTNGTVSDNAGNYSITVSSRDRTLVFSSVGYGTQEVAIPAGNTINVSLQSGTASLNEVVVVGYGTLRRSEVASAISSIKPDDFRQSGARNALDVAQGKIAGLTITRTGGTNPNSGVSIQIRGINTVSASTAPLIIIDGIPGGNLDLLQQDDIASIDVLKDGSAAAIYGTRANGGVILITTKKGVSGAARFDYANYFRTEKVARRPSFYNAAELRSLIAEGKLSASRDNPLWGGVTTDMFNDVINKNNLSQYHNMAISGGGRNTTYRASLFYQSLEGIAKQNNRTNYGSRISINHRGFNDKLSAQVNLVTNYNNANLLGGGNWETILARLPTQPIYNPNGSFYEDLTTTASNNQISILGQEKSKRQQQTSSLDAKFSFQLFKGLNASVFGAVQRNAWDDNQYKSIGSRSSIAGTTNGVTPNGTGYAYKGSQLDYNYALEPTIDYTTTIANDHSISAVAGYSYRYEVGENFATANSGYVNDLFMENNLGAGTYQVSSRSFMTSFKEDNTLIAFFGRANYTFQGKYIAQLIMRREGSSKFGTNNKWANFPAVALGWNISREGFMNGFRFVNNLKLRAGYGITGNSNFGNYQSLVTLSGGGFYLYPDGVWRQTYGPSRNPNPDLRWEKKKELNIGLDFSVLNNRLSGAVEVFRRKTVDLLFTYNSQLPAFITESIFANVGTIANNGVELTLNAVAVKGKDFNWNVDFTASTQSNVLETLSNDVYKGTFIESGGIGGFGALGNAIRTVEGGRLGQFYGKRFAGFDANGQWLFYTRDGKPVPFNQINTSSDPNVSDLSFIGNGIPKYYASLTNEFRYKNLDLRLFFRGKFGHDILNLLEMAYGNKTTPTNLLKSTFDRHSKLNSATSATYQYSDYYLEKGDYVKLDEVTLGYNFRFSNNYLRNLRVYASASNVATFTGYRGNDPDLVNDTALGSGLDGRGPYPSTRSFLVGLNIGF